MKLIGYARVSTVEQNLDLQTSALKTAGCSEIFTDHGLSGADFQRPGLRRALRQLKPDDMLVVWRLDRLGRSLVDLIQTVNGLSKRGSDFRSLTESIDTSSSGGRLVFHMMAAMAEFERAIISERTKAGMEAARARGSLIGRRRSMKPEQTEAARLAIEIDLEPVAEVAARYQVHPKTLARVLRGARIE
ncbi:recombinase family protein [Rhizobium leguminosarum]